MKLMEIKQYVELDHLVSSNGTNPSNMFNNTVSEKTTSDNDLVVVLTPGLIGAIGFAGLKGNSITIVGMFGAEEIFNFESTLSDVEITNWFDYFFEPFSQIEDIFVDGIPPYGGAEYTITIEGPNSACGVCGFGMFREFGTVEQGASVSIMDYSTKETDEITGVVTFDEGPFSRKISFDIFAQNSEMNKLQQVLRSVRAKPTFWSMADDTNFKGVFSIFGFYRDFSIVVSYSDYFLCSIEIEGLV